jgi:hypothetical protein
LWAIVLLISAALHSTGLHATWTMHVHAMQCPGQGDESAHQLLVNTAQ